MKTTLKMSGTKLIQKKSDSPEPGLIAGYFYILKYFSYFLKLVEYVLPIQPMNAILGLSDAKHKPRKPPQCLTQSQSSITMKPVSQRTGLAIVHHSTAEHTRPTQSAISSDLAGQLRRFASKLTRMKSSVKRANCDT